MTYRKARTPARKRIVVRTCGYRYPDLIGPFYPTDTKSNDMLGFYALRIAAVEVDSSDDRRPLNLGHAAVGEELRTVDEA